MNTQDPGRVKLKFVNLMPNTWLGRLLAAIVGLAMIWLGVLFFMLFLPIMALAIGLLMLRMLWLTRQGATDATQDFIEVEYRVEKPDLNPDRNAADASRTEK